MKQQDNEISILSLYLQEINKEIKIRDNFNTNKLFKNLIGLENKFKNQLKKTKAGKKVYSDFCYYINTELKDTRYAKAFFRSRIISQKDLNKYIGKNLFKELFKFPINFKFIMFALNKLKVDDNEVFLTLIPIKEKMVVIRNQIIEQYMFLALNKAKGFSSSSKSRMLEFSDFIQAANEGLVDSVDKYLIKDMKINNFHQVAVGKITANLIVMQSEYSSSMNLGSSGIKKLYKLRHYLQKVSNPGTISEISAILDIAESQIQDLMSATKYTSLDDSYGDGNELLGEYVTSESYSASPEDAVSHKEILVKLHNNLKNLSLLEKKYLIIKGVLPNE